MVRRKGSVEDSAAHAGSVLAVDPGETCGVAWMPLDALSLDSRAAAKQISHEQVPWGSAYGFDPEVSAANRILLRIRRENARIVLVESSASALLRPGMQRTKHSLVPLRIEAMLRFGLEHKWLDVRLEVVSPSQMSIASDSRMKAWGLWFRGEPHATDAARHLMVFMRQWKKEMRDGKH